MGSGNKKQTVGYKYYLGMHLVLCHGPIDKLMRIKFDNKTAWTGSATGGAITVDKTDLFGGESSQGGVKGTIDVEMGADTQTPNSYLVSKLGSYVPGFRGVMGLVFRQIYLGMNPYLKTPSFLCQRVMTRSNGATQWYSAKALIGQDMNGAHIIRECITDLSWGMGYQDSDVDDTSFQTAADTLYSEGMGISLLWDKTIAIDEFITEVLKHIDGSLYVDRVTGKFTLKLVRGGYSTSSLLTLDEDCIDKITDYKRSTLDELVNSVTVVYWDASTGENNSVTVQDIALASRQQAIIGVKKQFPGFTTGANATKAASRTLKQLSASIASGIIYTNRKAASLNIGDLFIVNWPRYGVSNLVMRVANIELGSLDRNVVKISAVEDVFATSSAIYSPPPASGWTDPSTTPTACPNHILIETPYWELVQRVGDSSARTIQATAGYIVVTGTEPSADARNATIYSNPTLTGYAEAGTVDFTPTATLTSAITITQTVLPLTAGNNLDIVRVGSYAVIDNEIVSVVAITDTTVTVGRGVADTVPTAHILGSRVYFADDFFETDGTEYAVGETARIKLTPTTSLGTLAVASAPERTVTIVGRASKPYVPQNVQLNGVLYASSIVATVPLVVTWAHRDRLQQTATLIDTTQGSIGPETGTTYKCVLLTQSGTVIATHDAIEGTTTTFTLVEMGANYGNLRIQLSAFRDSLESFQKHDLTFTRNL